MNCTVEELTKIKAGKAKSFTCDSPRLARSGQSLASYVKKFRRDIMPSDVDGYQTSIDGSVLTVIAIPKL